MLMLAYGRGRWSVSQKPKLIRKNNNNIKEKNYEICCSDEKKWKRKFPYANDLKYWNDFNITQLGRGRFPTHHDKNNERCSDIRPLGLYIQTKIRTKMNDNMSSYNHITYDQLL